MAPNISVFTYYTAEYEYNTIMSSSELACNSSDYCGYRPKCQDSFIIDGNWHPKFLPHFVLPRSFAETLQHWRGGSEFNIFPKCWRTTSTDVDR